jgi:hypothetical protein
VVKTPVRAPRANAFAERFVRERHLERVLVQFVGHDNAERPHRGIDLEVPDPPSSTARFSDATRVRRIDRRGGLLHAYSIAA